MRVCLLFVVAAVNGSEDLWQIVLVGKKSDEEVVAVRLLARKVISESDDIKSSPRLYNPPIVTVTFPRKCSSSSSYGDNFCGDVRFDSNSRSASFHAASRRPSTSSVESMPLLLLLLMPLPLSLSPIEVLVVVGLISPFAFIKDFAEYFAQLLLLSSDSPIVLLSSIALLVLPRESAAIVVVCCELRVASCEWRWTGDGTVGVYGVSTLFPVISHHISSRHFPPHLFPPFLTTPLPAISHHFRILISLFLKHSV